jgi:hypothetical protein
MYGDYQMTNISPTAMKDDKNSWLENYLYISFNEAENDNYTDKEVNAWVKRSTSVETSIRAMGKVYRKGRFYATPTLCSNDPGLHGLSRSDDATKRRIVVMMYKPNDKSVDWKDAKAIVEDVSFGYSLYKYMYDEWNITEDYDPTAYADDYDVWNKLHALKPAPVETFNEFLKPSNSETHDPRKPNYHLVNKYCTKAGKFKFYYICYHEACEEIMKHVHKLYPRSSMNPEVFKKGMLALGWTYDRKKSIRSKECAVLFRTEWDGDDGDDEKPVKKKVEDVDDDW